MLHDSDYFNLFPIYAVLRIFTALPSNKLAPGISTCQVESLVPINIYKEIVVLFDASGKI